MKKQAYVKASYEAQKSKVKKILLLYSGSTNSSVMLKWLIEQYKADISTLTVDLGYPSGTEDVIKKRALSLGAKKAFYIDAKEEFADEYIARALKANATYQGKFHLSTPLSRPLLAKLAIKIAQQEGIEAVAHGAGAKGNDQVRIEGMLLALNPDIKVVASAREWNMAKAEKLAYAKEKNIPIDASATSLYRYDANLWGFATEGAEIGDPSRTPELSKILILSKTPETASDTPETITIDFVKGIPVAINGREKNFATILAQLNEIGSSHSVGIATNIEDLIVGLKSRSVYEAPAAEILVKAHFALELFVSTRAENEFKSHIDQKWTYLAYDGLWVEPLMTNLHAYIDTVNQKVTGKVRVHLYKGQVSIEAVTTPSGLYGEKFAQFVSADIFKSQAAPGFIQLYTLPMQLSQGAGKTILISIGKRSNKFKLLPACRQLHEMGYKLYATYKTHKFLKVHGIPSTLVYKVFQPHMKPNLLDLLQARRFDLIINIPSDRVITLKKEKEITDGEYIRQYAEKHDVPLITNLIQTKNFVSDLSSRNQ